MRLKPGNPAPPFSVRDLDGNEVSLNPYTGKRLLLSFYRYASCPFCNLRVHELARRYADYRSGGLEALAVFQSPAATIRKYVGRQAPSFAILPDPARQLYRLYGVESSWAGLLQPLVTRWPELIRALGRGFLPGSMQGEPHRLPADFLVGPDLRLLDVYYGRDIGDHMPRAQIERHLA